MKKILFLFLLFCSASLHAGLTTHSNRLQGQYHAINNPQGMTNGSTVGVQDDQYNFMVANPATYPNQFTNCNVTNRLVLRYQESKRVYYSTAWSVTIPVSIQKWNATGVAITPNETATLVITYDPAAGTTYTDQSIYQLTNPGYKVLVTISGAPTFTGGLTAIPADVLLDVEIETSRSYVFNPFAAPTGVNHTLNAGNTLTIYWAFQVGAEAYDLEWVHLSSYDQTSISNPDYNRSTRITTGNNYYTISLPYDDGKLMYRVRSVAYPCTQAGFRLEGIWSGTSAQVPITNLDAERNWQYQVAYAEEGKRKEVVSFYDGTGKQRQAVTLNNTENIALVGETFYDYEGRAAVQTLPAPEQSRAKQLRYYSSLNLSVATNTQYAKKDFDKDALFTSGTCSWVAPSAMKNTSGSSNYYSPQNIDVNTGMHVALPDAQLYPFVQTVFNSDGRVAKQTAPGVDHNVGSGHEVETYYTTPTQAKLDRLFGNEAGYAEHYNQVSVRDANGQFSVSYIDLSGRTVATALIGTAPTALDALASNQAVSLTENFNSNNQFDASTGCMLVNAFYLVTDPSSPFNFTYTMTPEQYASVCAGGPYNCVYDLTINIYDACGLKMSGTNNVLQNTFQITGPASNALTKTFSVTFPRVGVYRIEKVLCLNQAALQAAVVNFQASLPGTCFSSQASLNSAFNAAIDLSDCGTCLQNCTTQADARGLLGTARQNFIDSCQLDDCSALALNENTCQTMLDVLAGDLSPGGQYFDNTNANNNLASDAWLQAYVWSNANATAWSNANFRDANNNLISSWAGMRTHWQAGWATRAFTTNVVIGLNTYSSLVNFHPEVCHYTWCTQTAAAKNYDLNLANIATYNQALNTTIPSSGLPYLNTAQSPVGLNILNADPYFNTAPGNADYNAMQTILSTYPPTSTALWTAAGTLSGCTNCDAQWILFRTLYVSEKARLMRAREAAQCTFLCDNTVPPDLVADACAPARAQGFRIRVPDLIPTLASNPGANWNSNAQQLVPCNTAATSNLIDLQYAVGASWGSAMVGCVNVLVNNLDVTCNQVCLNGLYTPEQIAQALVSAINGCNSAPIDFTAAIDPNDPSQFYLIAPAYLGNQVNNLSVTLQFLSPANQTTGFKFSGGVTNTAANCLSGAHCFCLELDQLVAYYNTTNPLNNNAFIVDHTLYTSENSFMVYALNAAYGTNVTLADVAAWRADCVSSNKSDPTVQVATPALPLALDCQQAAPCADDAYTISNFYASQQYASLTYTATQNFIAAYTAHCFAGAYVENFDVTHQDREYHYTLYYYDQAGSLTRTVPPAGVQPLNAAQVLQVNAFRTTGAGAPVYPAHKRSLNNLVTNYKYNTLNQVKQTATPDGGTTVFYYDQVGRILVSQNAKQVAKSSAGNNFYSYTLYDGQNRITEVGEIKSSTPFSQSIANAYSTTYLNWVALALQRLEVTSTYYDDVLVGNNITTQLTQTYLRKRIATVTIEAVYDGNVNTYDQASHYSYDVHSNVYALVQEFPELAGQGLAQRYKRMDYVYDLVSGNVNTVYYQKGKADQYVHQYYYDADNRITNVFTSKDLVNWERDAKYVYYLHGPMARTELGEVKVQGLDFAYTIHGWIKGVNSNILDRTTDLGKDGQAITSNSYLQNRSGVHSNIATDAFGYVLGFYWDAAGAKDWKPINTTAQTLYNDAPTKTLVSDNLFNGNIKEMHVALSKGNGTSLPTALPVMFNRYHYDQLNRIKSHTGFTGASTSSYATLTNTSEYLNTFTYDANGNIISQKRNGTSASGLAMDDLSYVYKTSSGGTYSPTAGGPAPLDATNQLERVDDIVGGASSANYADDLEDQAANNYGYDAIGQLVRDDAEFIGAIDWTVYNKIKSVTRNASSPTTKKNLEFKYDAMGQRTVKIVKDINAGGTSKTQEFWTYTYYVRDAQGNVMSTFERKVTKAGSACTDEVKLREAHVYGAARLGVEERSLELIKSSEAFTFGGYNADGTIIKSGAGTTSVLAGPVVVNKNRKLGFKTYELVNHLGNVLVTVSNRKLLKQATGNPAVIDYFMADVRMTSDYSAFGVALAGRSFTSSSYRYGFNGKELEKEIAEGDYDFGARIYDGRVGRFLSRDRFTGKFPSYSPYLFAGCSPIMAVDFNGDSLKLRFISEFVKKQYVIWLNKQLEGQFEVKLHPINDLKKYNYAVEIVATPNGGDYNKLSEAGKVFYNNIKGISSNLWYDVSQEIVYDDPNVTIGNYNTAQVDLADLLALDYVKGGPTGRGAYTHELVEQLVKIYRGYPQYDANSGIGKEQFEEAHRWAINVENKVNESVRVSNSTYENKDGTITIVLYSRESSGRLIVDKKTKSKPK